MTTYEADRDQYGYVYVDGISGRLVRKTGLATEAEAEAAVRAASDVALPNAEAQGWKALAPDSDDRLPVGRYYRYQGVYHHDNLIGVVTKQVSQWARDNGLA